jgi:hypothetical protein
MAELGDQLDTSDPIFAQMEELHNKIKTQLPPVPPQPAENEVENGEQEEDDEDDWEDISDQMDTDQ